MKKNLLVFLFGIGIGLLATGVLWLVASRPPGQVIPLLPSATPGTITVYVSGAVAEAGVYSLSAGSRVEAAVDAAGGFSSGAEQEQINLAAWLEDGQQVEVPGRVDSGTIRAARVNINTASTSELDALPGIGSTTAQAIVEYRLQHGNFQVVQDIQNVPGVGPVTYERIQDYITVGP